MNRCKWCNLKNQKYIYYHDNIWGKLNTSDEYLYKMLILESFQAGLSWECILNKIDNFEVAFDNFNIDKIINYDENKVNNLKTLLENETNLENIKELKKILNYFDKCKNKTSKACIKHLNTISKLSIINPINKYDYTNKIILSKNIMNKIDKLIINEYTEIKID